MTATAPTITTASSPAAMVAGLALAAAIGLGAGFMLRGATADVTPATTVVEPANPGTLVPATGPVPRGGSGTSTEAPSTRFIISSEPQLE